MKKIIIFFVVLTATLICGYIATRHKDMPPQEVLDEGLSMRMKDDIAIANYIMTLITKPKEGRLSAARCRKVLSTIWVYTRAVDSLDDINYLGSLFYRKKVLDSFKVINTRCSHIQDKRFIHDQSKAI